MIQAIKHDSCASREQAHAFDHRDVFTGFPSAFVSPSSARHIQHFRLSVPDAALCRAAPKLMTASEDEGPEGPASAFSPAAVVYQVSDAAAEEEGTTLAGCVGIFDILGNWS